MRAVTATTPASWALGVIVAVDSPSSLILDITDLLLIFHVLDLFKIEDRAADADPGWGEHEVNLLA